MSPPVGATRLIFGDWVVISPEEILNNGAIALADDTVLEIGQADVLAKRYPEAEQHGGSGRLVLPGLINTHTHLFQTFLKGLGQGLQLRPWVQRITTPAALAMTPEDAYLSAAVGLIEAVHSGATTVFEYSYAFPNPVLFEAILQAFVDVGVRGWLGVGLNDAGEEFGVHPAFIQPIIKGLAQIEAIQQRVQQEGKQRVALALTPSSIRGLSPEGLKQIYEYVRTHNLILSLHLNETNFDNETSLTRFNKRAIPWLAEMELIGPELLAVHCVQMDQEDIRLLANSRTAVSHNPVSNMYLGSGIAPVMAMRSAGITIGLGSDGAASNNSQDMIEVMKLAALGQRAIQGSLAILTAVEVFGMATLEGAKVLGQQDHLGQLALHCQADLVILRTDTSKMTPVHDPLASVVFSSGEQNVETVIVGGRVIMDQGKLTQIDEAKLLTKAQEAARNLVMRVNVV